MNNVFHNHSLIYQILLFTNKNSSWDTASLRSNLSLINTPAYIAIKKQLTLEKKQWLPLEMTPKDKVSFLLSPLQVRHSLLMRIVSIFMKENEIIMCFIIFSLSNAGPERTEGNRDAPIVIPSPPRSPSIDFLPSPSDLDPPTWNLRCFHDDNAGIANQIDFFCSEFIDDEDMLNIPEDNSWQRFDFSDTSPNNTFVDDTDKYDQIRLLDRDNERDVSEESQDFNYDFKLLTLFHVAQKLLL